MDGCRPDSAGASRVCPGGFCVPSCMNGKPCLSRAGWAGPGPRRQTDAGTRADRREARWALYWRTCHRHTDTCSPWQPQPGPETAPGLQQLARARRSACRGNGWTRPALTSTVPPAGAASAPSGAEPALGGGTVRGGAQGLRGLRGGSQAPPGRGPPSCLPFLSPGWATIPGPQGQVQGPGGGRGWGGLGWVGAACWGPVSTTRQQGALLASPGGVRLPCLGCSQEKEEEGWVRGLGLDGGKVGARPGPWGCPGAQAGASRARTCTLGRQNQEGGSSLLALSWWKRMWRKKSPV